MSKVKGAADPRTEWYVMTVGKSNKPVRILVGRFDALRFFYKGFNLTLREQQRIAYAWERGVNVGESILLVGYEPFDKYPDRVLTRVPGPELG